MRKLTFVLLFFTALSFGQNANELKTFTQKDFNAHKIHVYKYDEWNRQLYNRDQDTIRYFVDPAEYKGTINYGVEFAAYDKKAFHYIEDYFIYFQDVEIEKCVFNPKDSIVEISGSINGGWNIVDAKGAAKTRKVIVGEKRDTIYEIRLSPKWHSQDKYYLTYKNEVRKSQFVMDTLPAVYFVNTTFWKNIGGQQTFSIKCKVNRNSVLAFSELSTYTEMFDLGQMLFGKPRKPVKGISKRGKDDPRFVKIIEKNEQVKYRKPPKPDALYYQLTEKAENYILSRQYAKSKETYLLLSKEYRTIYARDIHNAIRCAILSRDMASTEFWGEKLAHKGVGIKYFNAKIFNVLKKDPTWKSFSKRYDSISTKSQSGFNHHLRAQLKLLTDEDQADYGLENRAASPVLYETTQRVTEKLLTMFEKEGFPSEEKIGVTIINDTIISMTPRENVLIRHAIQQKPKSLEALNVFLDKSYEKFEYDQKRLSNNVMAHNSCFHIYKGNLYSDKSCGSNESMAKKIIFKFNNPNNFIMHYGNFIVSEYDEESPEEYDKYYEERFNFVVKLTDDWKFYEK
jgi:hypothetical protein